MIHFFAHRTIILVAALLTFTIEARADEPFTVLATTTVIADTTKLIGGSRIHVDTLMGPGVDPHLYKASPGDVRRLLDSSLVLYNGLHLEGKLGDIFEKVGKTRPTVAVTDGIDRARLRTPPEFEGNYDPHVWFDVSLWAGTLDSIAAALSKVDPAGSEIYKSNAEKAKRDFESLHIWCKNELAKIPKDKRVLVTAHDAFGYFGRAYDVEVLAIQGVSTDSEASLKDLNALTDTLATRKIPAVFVESSVPHKTIEALVHGSQAKGHDVAIGGELYSDSLGEAGGKAGTYIDMVKFNVNTIVAALQGSK